MNKHTLQIENWAWSGTMATSEVNSALGFRPAFRDTSTGRVEIARLPNGQPAQLHLVDGLPDDWVAIRNDDGSVCTLLPGIESGFVRDGAFYTRDQVVELS